MLADQLSAGGLASGSAASHLTSGSKKCGRRRAPQGLSSVGRSPRVNLGDCMKVTRGTTSVCTEARVGHAGPDFRIPSRAPKGQCHQEGFQLLRVK